MALRIGRPGRRGLVAVAAGLLAVCATMLLVPRPAGALDDPAWWNAEIAKAEAEANRLWDDMRAKGTTSVGTALNEVDAEIHACHILSIMLGKDHLTPLLVAQPDPPQPGDEPGFAEGVEGNSRSNWAGLATTYLAETDVKRVRAWNLNCVGQFGITAQDAVREVVRRALVEVDGEQIRVLGNVEKGFFAELKTAIDANPAVSRIALGSAGGSVGDATRAGNYIRERGLATQLYDNCRSACALVFLGGVDRRIFSPYPEIGFHRISADGAAIADDSEVYDLVRRYADDLGVDGAAVVAFMHKAGVNEMHHPELDELCAANVATAVQRGCVGWLPARSAAHARQSRPTSDEPAPATSASQQQPDPGPGEGGPAPASLCPGIRAQRQLIAGSDPKIAGAIAANGPDRAGMLAMYDEMLRDYGC
ncbi:MAG: hypothetical protein CMP81_01365 [Fulvimarina sp.]|nr:hypothetical protein [Fulvimarina sp.]